ncbi:MAG: hypothetical protein ACREQJ_02285 [Candidatus Binatia bacterium]
MTDHVSERGEASPSYPWRSYRVLRTHDFIESVPRSEARSFRIFICRDCHRRFKFDTVTLATSAIGKDEQFSSLPNDVGSRWLTERCPGKLTAVGGR